MTTSQGIDIILTSVLKGPTVWCMQILMAVISAFC